MVTAFVQLSTSLFGVLPSASGRPYAVSSTHATVFIARPLRRPLNAPATLGQNHTALIMSSSDSGNRPNAKELAKIYGGSYLGTSISMSIVSYAVLYFLVYAGVDVRALTNAFGNWLATTPLGRPAALDNVSDAASAAAIAYVAHKVTSPLRFPLTIAATPLVARIFSKNGDPNASSEDDSTSS